MILERKIYSKIKENLFKNKVIILYGPRQVGKTTVLNSLQNEYPDSLYLNCDESDIREALGDTTTTELYLLFGNKKLILIDEAQRVKNIGITLKLVVDTMKDIQVVATGSSTFDLSNKIREPLTGRKIEHMLFPLAVFELKNKYSDLELNRLLEDMLIYGNYPVIRLIADIQNSESTLYEIATSYVYKDILQLERIKYPEKLEKLMRAIAHQVGNEVSYTELASTCELSRGTVEEYIRILEQAYIIFKLEPYSNNKRRTLKKLRKIYFWDNGIRNAMIKDFRPVSFRSDIGALFENFFIAEKLKGNVTNSRLVTSYFWRAYGGEEIDYIEEKEGSLSAYECKVKYEGKIITKSKNAPVEKCTVVTMATIIREISS
ncbi:MAG: ATP-binding protein [Candidatus Yonathbacteria bacterium]|nr:ATP-binding protein [Candidatus Yonathbacteria bacterium]